MTPYQGAQTATEGLQTVGPIEMCGHGAKPVVFSGYHSSFFSIFNFDREVLRETNSVHKRDGG
jgi:hypothetical protein